MVSSLNHIISEIQRKENADINRRIANPTSGLLAKLLIIEWE